jgi:hypothetical protein
MPNTENDNKDLEKGNQRKDQEQLSQIALGNMVATETVQDNDNDILSTPKTSGTGSNLAAASPHSLIVHEDKKEKDRYEEGTADDNLNSKT